MTLYLTYDGLTDPLGQSQILPYLEGLADKGYSIHIISFEKTTPFQNDKHVIEERLKKFPTINWHPLTYHARPKLVSTIYDLYILRKKAKKLILHHDIKIVHCRSYPTATVGMYLKRKLGVKYIFDMRGLFFDERFDGNIWNKNSTLWKWLYPKMKKLELRLFNQADEVISLTYNGQKEIQSWKEIDQNNFTVIPCAADLEHFHRPHNGQENQIKIVYLGSLGTWYLIPEMLHFFQMILERIPYCEFHIITRDNPEIIYAESKKINLDLENIKIYPASREGLPDILSKMDIAVYFIKDAYSKKASSPTKLGELLAMGIPVICNKNIGDINLQAIENPKYIHTIDLNNEKYNEIISEIPDLISVRKNDSLEIRAVAKKHFSLADGIEKYSVIYNRLSTRE